MRDCWGPRSRAGLQIVPSLRDSGICSSLLLTDNGPAIRPRPYDITRLRQSAAAVLPPEKSGQKRVLDMPDDLRISIDDLRARMKSGEDFAFIDTRNPQAWAQSDVTLPNAMRVPVDGFEQYVDSIPKTKSIVTYCT